MRYLLVTCTFLWLAQQPALLSPSVVTILNDDTSELFVSDVSLWEITSKHSAGKLPLLETSRGWVPAKLAYHQLQSLPLTQAAIFRSGELPRRHADPFDRLLAAQAIGSALILLLPDVPLSLLGASRMW